VWAPFVTIPALGAMAGVGAALLACRSGAGELVLESALMGSEIVLVVLAGLAVWIASRRARGPAVTMHGEAPLSPAKTVALGAFYVLAWVPRVLYVATPLFALARELGLEGASETLGTVLAGDRPALALAMTFVAGAVLAPIGEELLFRGLLLPHLARIVPPWSAIVISALLFGALHEAHGIARIGPMAIGMILGWARLRSDTLRAPIAIHMIVNATALSVGWLAG
ncbi:MAG: CPBP family intramembrane metalloprotease, partial [Myxococcota bacterium]|nr:CPBP family intramembrane metalloprotease [Myxococcota bacterium]